MGINRFLWSSTRPAETRNRAQSHVSRQSTTNPNGHGAGYLSRRSTEGVVEEMTVTRMVMPLERTPCSSEHFSTYGEPRLNTSEVNGMLQNYHSSRVRARKLRFDELEKRPNSNRAKKLCTCSPVSFWNWLNNHWLSEILACALSMACMVCIAGALVFEDGKPLTQWVRCLYGT